MVKQSSAPAAIEGSKIQIEGQDIKPGGPPIMIGENIMFPVHTYKRATGSILEESNPKIWKVRNYSMLDKDDEISGKKLWGLSHHPMKPINIGNIGRTGKHPGQDQTLNGDFSYLEIVQGWTGVPLRVHPRNELTELNPFSPR